MKRLGVILSVITFIFILVSCTSTKEIINVEVINVPD